MKVAITGASGFIGKHLVEHHLQLGDEINVLSRKAVFFTDRVNLFIGDLNSEAQIDPEFLRGVDVLYHCAAELTDESRMLATNVHAVERLIKLASGKVRRWVNLSSVGVYGAIRSGLVHEEFPVYPVNTYEKTKAAADRLVKGAAISGAFEYVLLRPSNVYGIGMRNNSLYELISVIHKGLFFYIGKPVSIFNYVHVSDVVKALYQCATHENAKNCTFIVSNSCSVQEFTQIINSIFNKHQTIYTLPESLVRIIAVIFRFLPNFPLTKARVDALTSTTTYSNSKIETCLNYRLTTSNQAGLTELVNFWRSVN